MLTGVPPSRAMNLLVVRVGARSFSPFRSARLDRRCHVEHAVACTWKASGLTSELVSAMHCVVQRLPGLAIMKAAPVLTLGSGWP
jgi:hypothetical protein